MHPIVFLALLAPASALAQSTLTVCKPITGTCDYTSIATAISNSEEGGLVLVGPGTYSEGINVFTQTVTIRSVEGPAATIIAASNTNGFVANTDSDVTLEGFTLQVNGAGNARGFLAMSSVLTLRHVVVANASRGTSGIGLTASQAEVVIEDSLFETIDAMTADGGAMNALGGSLTLRRTRISDCSAHRGGAIFTQSTDLTLEDVELQGNQATTKYTSVLGQGGAVYVSAGSLTVTGSTLLDNTASGDGGAIAGASSALVSLTDTVIFGSDARGNGGGLFCYPCEVAISGSTFALNAGAQGGGAYLATEGTTLVTDTLFRGNVADEGGGLWAQQTASGLYLGLDHAVFLQNTVSGRGGGTFLQNWGEVVISGSAWIGNDALDDRSLPAAGGLQATNISRLGTTESLFCDNLSNGTGGAVVLESIGWGTSAYDQEHVWQNTAFLWNDAALSGGAVAVANAVPEFINTGFYDNTITNGNGRDLFVTNAGFHVVNSVLGPYENADLVSAIHVANDPTSFGWSAHHDSFYTDTNRAVSGALTVTDFGSPLWSDAPSMPGYDVQGDCFSQDFSLTGPTSLLTLGDATWSPEVGPMGGLDTTGSWFADGDGDEVSALLDCDDGNAAVHPSGDANTAVEVCDTLDNDCNGLTDDQDRAAMPMTGAVAWYRDADADGYGDQTVTQGASTCAPLPGFVTDHSDCDDSSSLIHPGATEVPGDGVDNDCNPATVDLQPLDADGDGYPATADCNDANAEINPAATEQWYDGVDQDCAGDDDWDQDHDGWLEETSPLVTTSNGMVPDCDDTNAAIHPDRADAPYDGVDSDCGGNNDYDKDGDGYISDDYPGKTGGTALKEGDCADANPAIHPDADDAWYDGVDKDCDGANDYDKDGDGYVSADRPGTAEGTAPDEGDCNDGDALVNPGASEQWYDDLDQDCDGANDYDQDGDGVVHADHGDQAGGTAPDTGDCDDETASVHPGATEVPYNGVDDDCEGGDLEDVDGDGHVGVEAGGDDCDDTSGSVHPGADEIWYDTIDQDCDGNDDDQDGDGVGLADDCDDVDSTRHPGAEDVLNDGTDQDCDGEDGISFVLGGGGCSTTGPARSSAALWLLLLLGLRRRE